MIPRTSIARRLGAVIAMIALTALVLELGARVLLRVEQRPVEAPIKAHDLSALDASFRPDPYTWWRLKPDLQDFHVVGRCWGRDVDFRFSTNAEGYRGAPLAPAGTKRRVLALGDSVTFGLGVTDTQTWPRQLEEKLNAASGGDIWEVVNMGTPGYAALQGLRSLDKYGLSLAPDVVIACFGQNDFDTWGPQTDLERARADAENMQVEQRSPSDLFVLARRAVQGVQVSMADPNAPKQPRLTREEFQQTLDEIRKLCFANNLPLLLLRWPQEGQVLGKRPEPMHYEDLILGFDGQPGVTVVDLYAGFAARSEPLYIDPVHGNAAGCTAAAEALVAPVTRAFDARKAAS